MRKSVRDQIPGLAVLDKCKTGLVGRRKATQLVDLQCVLYFACLDPQVKVEIKAGLVAAWERLENRLARMRMQPEPKPIDVTQLARKKPAPPPAPEDPSLPG